MHVDVNGLEVLDRAECLALLATVDVGRVGLSIGALPVVLPVTFTVADERVLFRTSAGSKLQAASDGTVIAFEADGYDARAREGWSVLVQDIATATPLDRLSEQQRAGLPVWGNRSADHVVSLGTQRVSGRRLTA